jgi:DNA-binding SARP family transcriptional activator
VEFAVLGPLRVRVNGGTVQAGPAKQRALLALLLLRPNELVPLSAITEELWDQAPPRSTPANLRTYLAGVRGLLPGDERTRVVVRPHGYLLRVAAEELDAMRFAALAGQGQAALVAGEHRAAVDRLAEALGAWRGEVVEDVPGGASITSRRAALREQRLVVWEDLLAGRLALGETSGLRAQLRELVAADPVRERGWALLMTALYRAGDPAAALRAYAHARTAMVETLGIEPGPDLRRLQQLILDGVELPGSAAGGTGGHAKRPAGVAWRPLWQLPLDAAGFTGRVQELDTLTGQAAGRPDTVLAISGMAGVGKTALAIRWAHQHRDDTPDGQLYLDLRGYGTSRPMTPAVALGALLRSVGVAPDRVPPDLDGRASLWRTTLHGRRVLVLLDNARDDDQVRPLLPAAGLTLVTSRSQLRGLVAREGACRLILDRLPPADGAALLTSTVGPDRCADRGAVAALVERCAGLPLPLRIVAERAARQPGRPLGELADELTDERLGLDPLSLNEGESTDVRAVLSWSYQALDAPAARLFRLLCLHPGDGFDATAAAALAGLPAERAAGLLDQLAAGHLVLERRAGRYAFHDLLGGYATEQSRREDSAAARSAALARLLDWYVRTGANADDWLDPKRSRTVLPVPHPDAAPPARTFDGYDAALDWFKAESRTLLAATETAARAGLDAQCWRLAWVSWTFLQLGQPSENWIELYELALGAAGRTGDQAATAATVSILAMAHADLGGYPDAIARFERALDLYTELGDVGCQARTLDNLGIVCCRAGRLEEALHHQHRALRIDESTQAPPELLGASYNNISITYSRLGRHAEALAYAERAVAMSRPRGNSLDLALALDTLGDAYRSGGDAARAVPCYREAIAVNHRIGNLRGQAINWTNLGAALRENGDADGAAGAWQHALATLEDLHDPGAADLRQRIAELRTGC